MNRTQQINLLFLFLYVLFVENIIKMFYVQNKCVSLVSLQIKSYINSKETECIHFQLFVSTALIT